MVYMRGFGSGAGDPESPGLTDDDIHEMIVTQVTMVVREAIVEFPASIKIVMIEMFDEIYVALTETVTIVATTTVVVVGIRGG